MSVRTLSLLLAACAIAGCQALPDIEPLPQQLNDAAAVAGAIAYRTEGELLDAATAPETLTVTEAVQSSLAHAPEVQASLWRVRAALADAKQTRLLPNPLISIALRFPEPGGSPTIEASLAADLLSLIQRPRQASAADNRVREAAANALQTVIAAVAETEERFFSVQSLDAELVVLAERRAIVQRLLAIADARLRAGEAARLDVLTLDAQRAELELDITEKEAGLADERLALARILGQPSGAVHWRIAPWSAPTIAGTEKEWIDTALHHRPEIQAHLWELSALGDDAALARYAFLEGSPGISAERDGNWAFGPAIDMPLPIFDWGQARREKAEAQVVEARNLLVETQRKAVEEVRRAWASALSARRLMEKAESDLLPLQERRLAQAEAQYRNGQADVTAVLLAQQDAQAARSRLIEFQKNLALAVSRLHRAVSGSGVAPATASLPHLDDSDGSIPATSRTSTTTTAPGGL